MAVYYLDTSALVKRYVREPGTDWVLALADLAAVMLQRLRDVAALPPLTFVSADRQQREIAAAEGFLIEDPNAH